MSPLLRVVFALIALSAIGCSTSATPTTTSTPAVTIGSAAHTRYPSLEQVESLLQRAMPHQSVKLDTDARLIYADVTGDKEDDLIVSWELSVSLLLWTGSEYAQPITFSESPEKYASGSRVRLQDWTGDGTSETIFDYRGVTGGTGVHHEYWTRKIIHCNAHDCSIVWQGVTAALITQDSITYQGMDMFLNDPILIQTAGEDPVIVQASHAFSLYGDGVLLSAYLPEPVYKDCPVISLCHRQDVLHSRLVLYQWTGSTFAKIHESILSSPHAFPIFRARATKPDGDRPVVAEVSGIPDGFVFRSKRCQLAIDQEPVGNPFHCYPDYVEVNWIDATGDGRPEVVVKVVAGPIDMERNWLTDKKCSHEQLLVYQWNGKQGREVANVDGCVVREDLYGVRLEDLDSDGVLEIIAADTWLTEPDCTPAYFCWTELNHNDIVFKWDGTRFAFLRKVPRK